MPESEAFAIATSQSHALGKTPKGYGTSKAKNEAKEKYDTPEDDVKSADPGGIGKEAMGFLMALKNNAINPLIEDQARMIVRDELAKRPQVAQAPQNPKKSGKRPAKVKHAGISSVLALADSFVDELEKIANISPAAGVAATPGIIRQRLAPKKFAPNVTNINRAPSTPAKSIQPVSGPPSTRG